MRRTTGSRVAGAAVAVVLLGSSACGGSSEAEEADPADGTAAVAAGDTGTGTATESPDADAQALAFAECLRENGVEMPDPAPGQEGFFDAFHTVAGSVDQTTLQGALAACDSLFPTYAGAAGHGALDDEVTLELADCLRDQGLDVPDNLFEDGAILDIDRDELRAAMEQCQDVFTGAGR